jgi:hypothetical protein
MAPLPTELWLIIFDIVIEEGIIWLDHCDHTSFPHISNSLSSSVSRHHQQYDSYYRLRLVCRKFNSLLGARPWQSLSDSASLPFLITTRVLYLDLEALSQPHFQRLLPGRSAYGRLVYLDVTCELSQSPDRLNLSQFLHAGQVFSNVQRLTLRLVNRACLQSQVSFWTRLNRTFPFLVTLAVVTVNIAVAIRLEAGDNVPYFERLEILYLNGEIYYSGCHFPRLRHASVWQCSRPELETLTDSPHLESLLFRPYLPYHIIDATSFFRLKLLGFPDHMATEVIPLLYDHLVEHIWLFSTFYSDHIDIFRQLSRLPKVSRITVEFCSSDWRWFWPPIDNLRGRKFGSFELSTRSLTYCDRFLVFEREQPATGVTGGVLRKAWSKMRL